MNLLNLLIKEKRVAGIEISDSIVRIAFLRTKRQRNTPSLKDELVLIEEPIPGSIIAGGEVADKVLLGKTLRSIWTKARLDTPYAIVSIPNDQIYSRTFSFPRTVEGAKLTDAMKLAIGFQLPQDTKDIYLDWERTGGTVSTNEILLSTIPRRVALGYIEALDLAGIKTLALESHLASIARSITTPQGETILFTKKTPDGMTIFALKDNLLRFSRALPEEFITEKNIQIEISNVRSAITSELTQNEEVPVRDILDATLNEEFAERPELTSQASKAKWLIALGCMMRGKIAEGADNLISLLPVGTEEAYAYQKATTFITLLRNMTIGVSLFFGAAYLAAYLFTLSLAQNAERSLTTLSIAPVSPELLAKETWIAHVNDLTAAGDTLLSDMPLWSKVFEEIQNRLVPGTIALNFSAEHIGDKMTLVGQAKDRPTLNLLKKTFQESSYFTEVEMPITNLEQKSDIPFTLSFKIKDLNEISYKQP